MYHIQSLILYVFLSRFMWRNDTPHSSVLASDIRHTQHHLLWNPATEDLLHETCQPGGYIVTNTLVPYRIIQVTANYWKAGCQWIKFTGLIHSALTLSCSDLIKWQGTSVVVLKWPPVWLALSNDFVRTNVVCAYIIECMSSYFFICNIISILLVVIKLLEPWYLSLVLCPTGKDRRIEARKYWPRTLHYMNTLPALFGPIGGESTGHRWIPSQRDSDAVRWWPLINIMERDCDISSHPNAVGVRGDLRIHHTLAHICEP